MRQRIAWIDTLKAIGMILVILGHCIQSAGDSILFRLIYSFHMPLFFIISGLTFNWKRYTTLNQLAIAKAKSLLYPYLTLSACVFPIWLIERSVGAVQNDRIVSILVGSLYSNSLVVRGVANAGWFVITLFFAECFFYCIAKYMQGNRQLLLCSFSFCLLGVVSNMENAPIRAPFHLDVAIVCQFYLLIGAIIRENLDNIVYRLNRFGRYKTIITLLAISSFFAIANTTVVYASSIYGSFLYALISAIGFSFALIYIVQSWNEKPFLSFAGRNTIVYLMFQINILRLFERFVPGLDGNFYYECFMAIILFCILTAITWIINRFVPFLIRFPQVRK